MYGVLVSMMILERDKYICIVRKSDRDVIRRMSNEYSIENNKINERFAQRIRSDNFLSFWPETQSDSYSFQSFHAFDACKY